MGSERKSLSVTIIMNSYFILVFPKVADILQVWPVPRQHSGSQSPHHLWNSFHASAFPPYPSVQLWPTPAGKSTEMPNK